MTQRSRTSVGVMAVAHLTNDSYAYILPALLPLLLGKLGIGIAAAGLLVNPLSGLLVLPAADLRSPVRQRRAHPVDHLTGVALSGLAVAWIAVRMLAVIVPHGAEVAAKRV